MNDKDGDPEKGLGLGKLISLNAVIVIAAVLYWFGALAVYERSLFLQTANLTGATASYPEILLQGFESVLLWFIALPTILVSVGGVIPIVFNYDVLFRRLGDFKRRILFVCEMALFLGTAYLAVGPGGALSRGEQVLLLLCPDAKASGEFIPRFFALWTVLLTATLGYFVWRYLKEAAVRGKRGCFFWAKLPTVTSY